MRTFSAVRIACGGWFRYNISADPFEATNLADDPAHAATVATLTARLAHHAASADQVWPTLFWPLNESGPGFRPWNYQCPQCPHQGAICDEGGCHVDPWCDDVTCVPLDAPSER